MAPSRLRPGEALAGACGVALFAVMFAPWYEIGGNLTGPTGDFIRAQAARRGIDLARSAWQSFGVIDIVMLVALLTAVGLLLLTLTQRAVALPVAASVFVTVLGAVATLLVLYRLINEPTLTLGGAKIDDNLIEIRLWAYIGFALCGGIALGGFLAMADEGQRLAQAGPRPIDRRPAPAGGGEERPAGPVA